jgi:ABC-type microcin C transport system permease subunit YejE
MFAVAVSVHGVTVSALTFQLSVIVTDISFGFELLLGECSSLVGVVANEVSHFFGVSSDVFAPGMASEVPSCMFKICPDFTALRLVPVP